jgi:hypothetical protein
MKRADEVAALSECIMRCAAANDGRGQWRHVARCADKLVKLGTDPVIATAAARAAQAVSQKMRDLQNEDELQRREVPV